MGVDGVSAGQCGTGWPTAADELKNVATNQRSLTALTDEGASMKAAEVLAKLKIMGNEDTARVLRNHGAHDPCLGVKISDMKALQKQLKRDDSLSLELYDSCVYDVMYLAGLLASQSLSNSARSCNDKPYRVNCPWKPP